MSGEKVARNRWDGGGFSPIDEGHIAGIVDQFSRSAAWAFHGHSSLKETITTSSMTVSRGCFFTPILAFPHQGGRNI
jgi:hypothetical protein